MKKVCALIVLMMVMLTGCGDKMTDGKNLIAADCIIYEITSSPIPMPDDIHSSYGNEDMVFRTYDEVAKYIETLYVYDGTERIIEKLKSYDESFFDTKVLYFGHTYDSGNVRYEITGTALTENDAGEKCVEVYAKGDWEKIIESGASYSFFVTLEKSDAETVNDDNFSVVVYSK